MVAELQINGHSQAAPIGRYTSGFRPGTVASDVQVVIAAFNEGPAIGEVLDQLVRRGYSVIVVDDGSADDTVERASAYPVTVLQHPYNLGQGAALQTGINYALRLRETRYVVTFDADGQHSPDDIARLVEPLRNGEYDVALGSRFMKSDDAVDIRLSKKLMLQLAVLFTRWTTQLAVTDTHNGLRAFTVSVARSLEIQQNRMAHASEILARIAQVGARYCEVPVTIRYTAYSLSKGQSLLNGINILWDTMRLRLR